jgi:hypothetical protein
MAQSLVISGLVAKRAELAGEIETAEKVLADSRQQLAHIDAAIRIFDPAYPLASIKSKAKRSPLAFNRGELIRDVLDMLRTTPAPMTVAELAAAYMQRKAMPAERGTRELVEGRVDKALRRKEGEVVERVVLGPRAVAWRLKQPAANTHAS